MLCFVCNKPIDITTEEYEEFTHGEDDVVVCQACVEERERKQAEAITEHHIEMNALGI